MKTHLSLFILSIVLFCCGFARAEESSFYDLPKGAFVVELSDMKTSGCHFYVFGDKSNNQNKWGYYVKDGVETYPESSCLAVSVHAMFPALYAKEDELLDVIIPASGASQALGNCPTRTIFANYTAQFTITFRGKSLTYNVMQLP